VAPVVIVEMREKAISNFRIEIGEEEKPEDGLASGSRPLSGRAQHAAPLRFRSM
jgi:hypothetical protein